MKITLADLFIMKLMFFPLIIKLDEKKNNNNNLGV